MPHFEMEVDGEGIFSANREKRVKYLEANSNGKGKNEFTITHYASKSGKGGQGVNTANNGRKVVHNKTGFYVEHAKRGEYQTLEMCASDLKQMLLKQVYEKRQKSLFGSTVTSLDRSDKIRSYNYKDNRITDHRLGLTVNEDVEHFISMANFDVFIEPLFEKFEEEMSIKLLGLAMDQIE